MYFWSVLMKPEALTQLPQFKTANKTKFMTTNIMLNSYELAVIDTT